jgi:hypothetical protein
VKDEGLKQARVARSNVSLAPPLARVRPRRKRNEDGGVPPMQLNDLAICWPLMFLKRSDSCRSKLKDHP